MSPKAVKTCLPAASGSSSSAATYRAGRKHGGANPVLQRRVQPALSVDWLYADFLSSLSCARPPDRRAYFGPPSSPNRGCSPPPAQAFLGLPRLSSTRKLTQLLIKRVIVVRPRSRPPRGPIRIFSVFPRLQWLRVAQCRTI